MSEVERRGLVQVYKGRGKGKSTAALGLAFRAVGQGLEVLIVQFMKSTDFITGEKKAAKHLEPQLKMIQFGDSSVWGLGVPKRKYDENAKKASRNALDYAKNHLKSKIDILILDEIGIALHLGLLDKQEVIDLIKNKPNKLELVLTGVEMADEIIEIADLVSNISDIKHPFNNGIQARRGIEY